MVADGDDDGTLAAIAAADVPFGVRTLRLPRRSGAATARNAAAAAARGQVLLFSDDDCVPDDDNLERHWRAHAAAPGPTAMVGALTFVAEDGGTTSSRPRRVGYWNLNGANASVPAADFAAVGGFDEGLEAYGGEDVLLGYELLRRGVRFRALPEAHARHLGPTPPPPATRPRRAARGATPCASRAGDRSCATASACGPRCLRAKRVLLPWFAWRGPAGRRRPGLRGRGPRRAAGRAGDGARGRDGGRGAAR